MSDVPSDHHFMCHPTARREDCPWCVPAKTATLKARIERRDKGETMSEFEMKASGERKKFDSGMVRDVDKDKTMYDLVFDGPLFERYAYLLTKGAHRYARRNWMQANSFEERDRFRESAVRHFVQWLRGDTDEDHFAATLFNMNGAEYVEGRMSIGEVRSDEV